jgi:hypothetical protein
MAKLLKLRGGTTSQHGSFTGADREVTVDTDKETLVVHNGSTAGGFPLIRNVVEDATPQLGGNLDVNTKLIKFGDSATAGADDTLEFGAGDDMQLYHDGSNSYITNATGALKVATETSGIAVTIGHTTSEVTIADNATIVGSLTLGSTALTSNATELNQLDGKVAKTAGKESIWVPAGAMYPSTTNPCSDLEQVQTTALRPDLKVLDFATGADEFAQFSVAFPKSWNEGTVTFQPYWTVTGTNTGDVVWALSGIAVSNDDTINTAFGTPAITAALAHSGTSNDLMVTNESGAITIAGSPAVGDVCFFQIARDVSFDSQTGDARLIGLKLFFTTDAANDS